MKTYYITDVSTTNTPLGEGTKLCSLYVTNKTAASVNFTLMVDAAYFIKDVSVPPGVSLSLIQEGESCKIYHELRYIYISAGTADALDVVFTAE